jgi:hypothetical protein
MDMISWAATLSSTKLVLLAKVVAEVVAVPGEAAGVVVTAEVVEAAEAEAVVVVAVAVAVAVAAAGVTAVIAVVEAEEIDAGNGLD